MIRPAAGRRYNVLATIYLCFLGTEGSFRGSFVVASSCASRRMLLCVSFASTETSGDEFTDEISVT